MRRSRVMWFTDAEPFKETDVTTTIFDSCEGGWCRLVGSSPDDHMVNHSIECHMYPGWRMMVNDERIEDFPEAEWMFLVSESVGMIFSTTLVREERDGEDS